MLNQMTSSETQENATTSGQNSEQAENKSKLSASEQDETQSEESDATESESESSDESEIESLEATESEKPKKQNGVQKKINKLTKRASEAERELAYWKEAALKSNGTQKPAEQIEINSNTSNEGEPNPDDFNTNAEYIKACVKWEREQERKTAKAESEKTQAQVAIQKQAESFQSKLKEFEEKQPDFQEVIEDCEVDLSQDLQRAIFESDLAPNLMYHLASKPEEIEKLNGLSGSRLVKALGIIEHSLSEKSDSQPKEVKTSKAPAPISPVGSKGSAVLSKSLSDPNISFQEYERLRLKEMKSANRY